MDFVCVWKDTSGVHGRVRSVAYNRFNLYYLTWLIYRPSFENRCPRDVGRWSLVGVRGELDIVQFSVLAILNQFTHDPHTLTVQNGSQICSHDSQLTTQSHSL